MGLNFEWDERKSISNRRKHGVSFDEAASAFGDPFSITIPDPDHSEEEDRFVLIGESVRGRLVVVVHTERGDNLRMISARVAKPSERRTYEQD
ncbi:MAG TPA: BrnT family toxin [Planctomycetota bacterium]